MLPDLMGLLPDWLWRRLLSWLGITEQAIRDLFDEDTEPRKETLRCEDQ